MIILTSSLPQGSGLGVEPRLRLSAPGSSQGLLSLQWGLLVLLGGIVCLLVLLLSSPLLLLTARRSSLLVLRVQGGVLADGSV